MEIFIDTLTDSLKLVPFLFVTFLIMEYLEHKTKSKNSKLITKAGKLGSLIGSVLGAFPQCGFSVAATNLYATRIITLGTLIAIYLSTSDEMLPILLSNKASISLILKFLLIKIIVGVIFGFIIDIFTKNKKEYDIKDFCEEEHCDCNHGIIKSSIKHTVNITIFIFAISFILDALFSYLGEDIINKIFMKNSIFGPFLTSLIGLIPNCASSVVITELYLSKTISFAAAISGLLTGSGVAILVLFKVNKNLKENIKILSLIYFIGVFVGLLIEIMGFFI